MDKQEHLEITGRRAIYRPLASTTFERAVDLTAAAMRRAREAGCTDMLANLSGFTGFPSPDTIGRYSMALKWAESAGTQLRVALVVRAEVWDPQKIATLMAQNRGVSGDIFLSEVAALRWLDSFTST